MVQANAIPVQLSRISLCDFGKPEVNGDGRKRVTCQRCGYRSKWLPSFSELQVRPCGVDHGVLPGLALKALLVEFQIVDDGDCGCDRHALQMNMWGENAAEHRGEIIAWLKAAAGERGWGTKIAAGWKMKAEPWFNLLDPYGSLVDEAIRRATT